MKLSLTIPGLGGGQSRIEAPPDIPTGGLGGTFPKITGTAIEVLFIAAIILTLFFLIWAGIRMMIFGGKKEELAKSRGMIFFAVIGLSFIFLSILLIRMIGYFFGIELLP